MANAIANQPEQHVNVTKLLATVESVEGLNEENLDFCFKKMVKNPMDAKMLLAYGLPGRRRFLWRLLTSSNQ